VDVADFQLTTTGISGVSIASVTGSGAMRTVTVNTGPGKGTLRLDSLDNDTILDSSSNHLGGLGIGNGAFSTGETYTVNRQLSVFSNSAQDGWILESSETSNAGGNLNAIANILRVGDDKARKQYRSIVSFKTSDLPDNAVITAITIKLKQQSVTGGATLPMFQGLLVDVVKGTFGTSALQTSDFQAVADKSGIGPFKTAAVSSWYTFDVTNAASFINKVTNNSGLTQFRLRLKLDDNNNSADNFISFFSGNNTSNQPSLVIAYYVP
jgi:hypothetical protein